MKSTAAMGGPREVHTVSSDDSRHARAAYCSQTATSLRFTGQASLPTYTLAGSSSTQVVVPAQSRLRTFDFDTRWRVPHQRSVVRHRHHHRHVNLAHLRRLITPCAFSRFPVCCASPSSTSGVTCAMYNEVRTGLVIRAQGFLLRRLGTARSLIS